MTNVTLAIVGLGNVGTAILRYLQEPVIKRYLNQLGVQFQLIGLATGRRGTAVVPDGIKLDDVLAIGKNEPIHSFNLGKEKFSSNEQFIDRLAELGTDLIGFFTPSTKDGQPDIGWIKRSLTKKLDVVTSNKSPIAWAHEELMASADQSGRQLRFNATVLAGNPAVLYLKEWPGYEHLAVEEIQAVVNATSNQILTFMAEGRSFEEGVEAAQELGIAEKNYTDDTGGYDTQKKIVILANQLMGAALQPDDVPTEGIDQVTPQQLKEALAHGQWVHLLARAWRADDGAVRAEVKPTQVSGELAGWRGRAMGVVFKTATHETVFFGPGANLTIKSTAAGVFYDLIQIAIAKQKKTQG